MGQFRSSDSLVHDHVDGDRKLSEIDGVGGREWMEGRNGRADGRCSEGGHFRPWNTGEEVVASAVRWLLMVVARLKMVEMDQDGGEDSNRGLGVFGKQW